MFSYIFTGSFRELTVYLPGPFLLCELFSSIGNSGPSVSVFPVLSLQLDLITPQWAHMQAFIIIDRPINLFLLSFFLGFLSSFPTLRTNKQSVLHIETIRRWHWFWLRWLRGQNRVGQRKKNPRRSEKEVRRLLKITFGRHWLNPSLICFLVNEGENGDGEGIKGPF